MGRPAARRPAPPPDPGDEVVLTVLGCDGSWPGPGGAGSGYLLRVGGTHLLLDAGPGTFAVLQTLVDPGEVDAVVISHHHADHWTDLYAWTPRPGSAAAAAPCPSTPRPRWPGGPTPSGPRCLEWHDVTDGSRAGIGEVSCAFHRTDHAEETLAVRVDGGGRALGYSADTGPDWSPDVLGSGLDLLLCEATYTAEHEGTAGHLSGRQAGAAARAAGAQRLVITHRWPTVDAKAVAKEAEAAFGGPVEQAAIGKEFTL